MQITWMEFMDHKDVKVSFTNSEGTEINGIISYLHSSMGRPSWIFYHELYEEGNIIKDIRYEPSFDEIKQLELLMNEALKHPDGPNAHTMKLFYEDTL